MATMQPLCNCPLQAVSAALPDVLSTRQPADCSPPAQYLAERVTLLLLMQPRDAWPEPGVWKVRE